MVKDTYSGRTTLIVAGGQQMSITVYRRSWTVAVEVILALAFIPAGAGLTEIAISVVVAFIVSTLLVRAAVRRLVASQVADWVDLDERLAFERAAVGIDPAGTGYIPRPGMVARELNDCRKFLIGLVFGAGLMVVTCTISGLIGDTPVTRTVSFVLIAIVFGSAAMQVQKRIRAMQTLQHLDPSV